MSRKVYIVENLCCAHCAAQIEEKINALPQVEEANLTFTTKQLRVTAEDPDSLLEEMNRIAKSIEEDAVITPRDRKPARREPMKKVYIIENLCCAHCAARIEEKIKAMPQVQEATLTFTTKQLRVTAEDPDSLLEEMNRIAKSVEEDAVIIPRDKKAASHKEGCGCSPEHHHDDACGCALDHHHGHNHEAHPAEEAPQPIQKAAKNISRQMLGMIIGGVLFLLGLLTEDVMLGRISLSTPIFTVSYLFLGWDVLRTAFKNMCKGRMFDENFLMAIATVGAFIIGEFPEAAGVMLFYRIGEFFEAKAVHRSRSQIMEAVDLRPEVCNLVADGQTAQVPAEDIIPGDLLLVRPGDRIPLDGVVVSGQSRIDTAPITGESVPVGVEPGDPVISGCVNTSGQLMIRVEKPLSESMVTRILDSVENAAASKPKIDRFITRFARVYTPLVVGVAAIVAVVPSVVTGDWNYWIYTALSFLVMSCPCALVLSVPLAFFSGIGAGSKRGILFKGGLSIEAMADVKAVVMDKTGTITRGDFRVTTLNGTEEMLGLAAAAEQHSTHPIGQSIVEAARERGLALPEPSELEEIPGHGIRAVVDGRTVLCGNEKLMHRFGIQPQGDLHRGGTCVLVAVDGAFAGSLVIADTLKDGAKEAVGRLNSRGFTTAMLTGDAEVTAQDIASRTGIREVHAKLLPDEKLSHLQQIRQQRGNVMFVGDGINDAPVLAGADVGAAMGSGADAAIEAADVVFMTSDVDAIPASLDIARQTSRIAWQNVVFALAIKVFVMLLGLAGHASMWMAVFADSGVAMLCVLNSIRILYQK